MKTKSNEKIKIRNQEQVKIKFRQNVNNDFLGYYNDLNEDDPVENEDTDENIDSIENEDVNDEEVNEEITYLDSIIEDQLGKASSFSEKRVLFHIVKIGDKYKVFDTGFRSYGGFTENFEKKLKFSKDISLVHSCLQSYLNGFFEFEEVDAIILFAMFPSHLFLRKDGKSSKNARRSFFTMNYIRFANEIISMNLLSPNNSPKKDKVAHTIFRIYLGENLNQKKKFLKLARKYSTNENQLIKTGNVDDFFERIKKYSEREFPGNKINELIKTINQNDDFQNLIKTIRDEVVE